MLKTNDIQYLYDRTTSIELILCSNSLISYPLHNHVSIFTIGVVLHGSIFLTVGNNSYICEQDRPFMILPYMPHIIEAKEPYTLLTICINKNTVSQFNKEEIKNNFRHLIITVFGIRITEMQIIQLLNCLDSLKSDSGRDIIESSINLAKNQLECFPEVKLSIEEMARAAFISKYHFIRSFKQAVGLTPHQFQIQNRIRKAQEMLKNIDSITDVALSTGFCDQSHFIKQFEKYVGLTPTAYKFSCRYLNSNSRQA